MVSWADVFSDHSQRSKYVSDGSREGGKEENDENLDAELDLGTGHGGGL